MNVRILAVLAVTALALAAWFYSKQEEPIKPALPEKPTASYEVTQIQAVQTNPETGQTEYTVTADSLVKNDAGEDEMRGATVRWQPPQGESFILTADKAQMNQETGELYLSNGFTMQREATAQKAALTIQGRQLTANTKQRTVSSQEPLTVVQGEDRFKAAGFSANLATGEYTFERIEVLFNAPKREDKSLF